MPVQDGHWGPPAPCLSVSQSHWSSIQRSWGTQSTPSCCCSTAACTGIPLHDDSLARCSAGHREPPALCSVSRFPLWLGCCVFGDPSSQLLECPMAQLSPSPALPSPQDPRGVCWRSGGENPKAVGVCAVEWRVGGSAGSPTLSYLVPVPGRLRAGHLWSGSHSPGSSRHPPACCQGRSTPFLSKPSRVPPSQLPPHAELFIAPTWGCVCPEMGRWPWDTGVTRGTG